MRKNLPLMGRLAIFLTAIIWGTSFVVLKNALDSVGTLWILAIRFSVSSVLLLALSVKKLKGISRRCIRGSVIMGALLAVAYIVQTYGLVYTTPGKNAFLTSTYCVLTPFFAWGMFKRKPGILNVVAAVMCVAGIGFVSLNEGFGAVNRGDVLTLLCGIFYAFQISIMEAYSGSGDASVISAIEFTVAALICWTGALIFEQPPVNVPTEGWLNIAYLSVMCTAVCFFLQAWGMKYTPSSTAAMLMTLEAVFGVIISVIFYGELLTVKLVIGFALIFFSVIISEMRPKALGNN